MDTTLSVIVPNFNHAQYLPRTIAAIAGQSRKPDEFIIIDDGSTDGSREVIASCQRDFPGLSALFNPQNLGAIPTLQRGLQIARGTYIYFAAADDQILPGFFETALTALEAAPQIGLFCAETVLVDGATGRPIGRRPIVRPRQTPGFLTPQAVGELLRKADNFIHTGSSVFRRESLLDKGGFPAETGSFSDGLLARKVALSEGLCFAPIVVSRWLIHREGYSRTTALNREHAVDALAKIPEWIAQDHSFPNWYPELFRRRWRFGSARLALEVSPPDRELLAAMIPDTILSRLVYGALEPLLKLRAGRLALLGWLALALRPFDLREVLKTALNRRFRRI
jgi:glycosyltransferase involved in cell wall biosynthesis